MVATLAKNNLRDDEEYITLFGVITCDNNNDFITEDVYRKEDYYWDPVLKKTVYDPKGTKRIARFEELAKNETDEKKKKKYEETAKKYKDDLDAKNNSTKSNENEKKKEAETKKEETTPNETNTNEEPQNKEETKESIEKNIEHEKNVKSREGSKQKNISNNKEDNTLDDEYIIKTDEKKSYMCMWMQALLEADGVKYKRVRNLSKKLTDDEIIRKIGGKDLTTGSCVSLACAYIANKNGLDVIDYRGGNSCENFKNFYKNIHNLPGVITKEYKFKNESDSTVKILTKLKPNKEYYISLGTHDAIFRKVKKSNGKIGYEYLELQSKQSGWINVISKYGTLNNFLKCRFNATKTAEKRNKSFKKEVLISSIDSFKNNREFQHILGFINTAPNKQNKVYL